MPEIENEIKKVVSEWKDNKKDITPEDPLQSLIKRAARIEDDEYKITAEELEKLIRTTVATAINLILHRGEPKKQATETEQVEQM